jgi:hypothetical protein
MRKAWCAVAAAVALITAGESRSGDENAARALVEKAVKAQGGADKLAKFNAASIKGKGTFFGQAEQGVPFEGEWQTQGKDQMRMSVRLKSAEGEFKLLKVVNGAQGWEQFNKDKSQKMSKDKLAEERVQMYASWVASLVPLLQEKGFKLAPLGESKVGDKAAVGIKVSHEGQRDVKLYFDKSTGLLAKSEVIVKDIDSGSGKDMVLEIVYDNYKEVAGAKQPMRMSARRDGKKYIEGDLSEFNPAGKFDDKTFGQP